MASENLGRAWTDADARSISFAHYGLVAIMYLLGNWLVLAEAWSTNVNVVDVRNTFSEYLNRVYYQGQRIVIERRGKPVAALVSMEDLARLNALEDQADMKVAKKARKENGGVSLEKGMARLGMK